MTIPCCVKTILGKLQIWKNYNQKLKTLKITKTYKCSILVFHLNSYGVCVGLCVVFGVLFALVQKVVSS